MKLRYLVFVALFMGGIPIADFGVGPFDHMGLAHAEDSLVDSKANNSGRAQTSVTENPGVMGEEESPVTPVSVLRYSFRFEGNNVLSDDELKEIAGELVSEKTTLDDIKNAAAKVTAAYKSRGYLLASAYIPPQEVTDGLITIRVVEGDLDTIEVTGNSYFEDALIKKYFQPLEKRGVIHEQTLLSGVLHAKGDIPADINAVLKKGEKPGTTGVILNVQNEKPYDISFDYNNHGSKLISRNRYGTTFSISDPLIGSRLTLRAISGDTTDDTFLYHALWSVPLGSRGTDLSFNYMFSDYNVGGELSDLGLKGDTEVWGVNLRHPLVSGITENLSVSVGYQNKDQERDILSQDMDHDALSVFNVNITGDKVDRLRGKSMFGLGIYRGVEDFLGSLESGDRNVSRAGAKPDFTKYVFELARYQALAGKVAFLGSVSGQYTGDRLFSMEQFSLGGAGSVRGFTPSAEIGDKGYAASLALLSPPPFLSGKALWGKNMDELIQLSLFYDFGEVWINDTMPGESRSEDLSGTGAGVGISCGDMFNLKFETGFPVESGNIEFDDPVYYLSVVVKPVGMYKGLRKKSGVVSVKTGGDK